MSSSSFHIRRLFLALLILCKVAFAQTLTIDTIVEDFPTSQTHSLLTPLDKGGLTMVQSSRDLQFWSTEAYWWGYSDSQSAQWPLFSVAKPTPGSSPNPLPEPPEPAPVLTSVSLLLELAPEGLIASWPTLDSEAPIKNRPQVRYQFTDLPLTPEDIAILSQRPIHTSAQGGYFFHLFVYRTGGEIIAPFNPPLTPNDAAMAQALASGFQSILLEIESSVTSALALPPPPPPAEDSSGFWRVINWPGTSLDSDGDGLTNAQEIDQGTNWLAEDSDLDGLPDGIDPNPLNNEALADPDGANHGSLNDTRLLGRWDFEKNSTNQGLTTSPEALNPGLHDVTAPSGTSWDGPRVWRGMPSRAVHLAGGPWTTGSALSIPSGVLGVHDSFTTSLWLQFPESPFKSGSQILQNGEWSDPISHSQPKTYSIATFGHRAANESLTTPALAWVLRPEFTMGVGNTSRSWDQTSYHLALENWRESAAPQAPRVDLALFDLDLSELANGEWHHLTLSFASGGAVQAALDGQLLPPRLGSTSPVPSLTFNQATDSYFEVGRFGPYSAEVEALLGAADGPRFNLPATIDRLRLYRTILPQEDITALFKTDIDRDGLTDLTESASLRWYDRNNDSLPNTGEFSHLLSPFVFDSPTLDHDYDGLVSLTEQDLELDPANPDTDGDTMPDGWEVDNLLTANDSTDASANADTDELTNVEEYLGSTDPNNPDTDDDGLPDHEDIPPQWLSVSRDLDYDYDDYVPDSGDENEITRELATAASWPTAGATFELLTQTITYDGLSDELEGRQAFPEPFVAAGIEPNFVADGLASTYLNPPCYHADLEHRQVVLKLGVPVEEDCQFQALRIVERSLNSAPITVSHETVTTTIEAGETHSQPFEISPSFATTGQEPGEQDEMVAETLVPFETHSADRMFAASLTLPFGGESLNWDNLTLRITGPDNKVRGDHTGFFHPTGPYLHESDLAITGEETFASLTADPDNQPQALQDLSVVFCKRPGQYQTLEFYALFDTLGTVKVELFRNGVEKMAEFSHSLTAEPAFYHHLRMMDGLITTGLASAPAASSGTFNAATVLAAIPSLNYLRPLAGPFQGLYSFVSGICHGAIDGLKDDLQLLVLIGGGTLLLGDALLDQGKLAADLGLLNYQTNLSLTIAGMITDFMDSVISTDHLVEGGLSHLKFTHWTLLTPTGRNLYLSNKALQIQAAVFAWHDSLMNRILEDSEATLYQTLPWPTANNLLKVNVAFSYATGYGAGYILEQVFLTKGIGALAKVGAKGAAKVSLKSLTAGKRLLPQSIPLMSKFHAAGRVTASEFDEWLASFRFIFHHPFGQPIPVGAGPVLPPIIDQGARRPITEVLNEAAEKIGGADGAFAGTKKLLEDALDAPNIKRNALNIRLFEQRIAQLSHILGDQFDDEVAENFLKIYDKRLLRGDGIDIFDDWLADIHSSFTTGERPFLDQIGNNSIARIVLFLKGPNPFSPWKMGFQSPGNLGNAARGYLIELFEMTFGKYQTWTRMDGLDSSGVMRRVKGLDGVHPTEAGHYLQITSTSSLTPNLANKLSESAAETIAQRGTKLTFDVHWLASNGQPNLTSLNTRKALLEANLQITIIIQSTSANFNQWTP